MVIEKTSPRIFIDDDTGELVVYLKKYAPIDKSGIKEGDRVEIIGVLSQSNDELWLLPRNNQDIQIIKNQNNYRDPEAIVDSLGQRQDFQILASGAKIDFNKFRPYLIISTIILGIIFIILLLIKKSF